MWDVLIQILPMILPLIIDLFDKGPAACKLWGAKFDRMSTSFNAIGTERAEALSAATDIIAGTLKCCAAKPELCEMMAKAARSGPEAFANIAMSMSQETAV